jgi:UDP-N-acetylmuramyl pentapeptide synthase
MGEHAAEMISGALKAGMSQDQVAEAKTPAEMQSSIESRLKPGVLVFLKGSRKMGLEKVVQGLQKNLGLKESKNGLE